MSPQELRRLVRSARFWALWYETVFGMGPVLLGASAVLLSAVLLDLATALAPAPRRGLWLAGLVAALWCLYRRAKWGRTTASAVAAAIGRGAVPADQYRTAWELIDIPGAFATRARASLPALSIEEARRRLRPAGWRKSAFAAATGAGAILAFGGLAWRAPQGSAARMLWPFFAENLDAAVEVLPGDALFPRGGGVHIDLRLLAPSEEAPVLVVAEEDGRWRSRPLEAGAEGEFHAVLQGLTEPLRYRVILGRRRGRVHRLTPFDPPRLRRFTAEIHYPAYAGKSPERAENPFAPEAPVGGRILFEGEWETAVLSADFIDESGRREAPAAQGRVFRWERAVKGPETVRLWAALAATSTVAAELRIAAREDARPRAAWLFPDGDLRVAGAEEIPAAAEVDDDYGVDAVFLEVAVNTAASRRFPWGAPRAADGGVIERPWRLGALNLQADDKVEAAIVAVDRAGQEGRSETRRLFVAPYEAEHEEIKKGLADFQKAMFDLLAAQSALEAEAAAPAARPGLAEREARLGETAARDAEALRPLLRRMAEDPQTDEATLSEFHAIQADARELAARGLPEAAAGLRKGELGAMADATAELERLALAAERAREAQNTRRLMAEQRALADRAAAVEESLADGLSAGERAALEETVRRMEESLRRVAERLRDLPQDLSEDFLNQPAVKTLDFDAAAKSLRDLADAVKRGDGAAALAAARAALSRLREMEKALGQAGTASLGQGGSSPALMAAIEEARAALEKLAGRQEALLEFTRGELERNWRARLAGQDRALADLPGRLAEARRAVALLARDVGAEGAEGQALQVPGVLAMVNALMGDAERAAREGEPSVLAARLEESETLLRGLARMAERARQEAAVNGSTPSVAGLTDPREKNYNRLAGWGARAVAAADLLVPARRWLGEGESPAVDAVGNSVWGDQAERQSVLAADTRAFTQKLAGPSRETALLGGRLFRRLRDAIAAMEVAVKALTPPRPVPAAAAQEEALNHLREAGESLGQSAGALRQRGQSGGRAAAPTMQRGGGGGAASAPVRIPRAGEFRPPAEFREELSRSLKERYPKNHERAVQEYFRHWTK